MKTKRRFHGSRDTTTTTLVDMIADEYPEELDVWKNSFCQFVIVLFLIWTFHNLFGILPQEKIKRKHMIIKIFQHSDSSTKYALRRLSQDTYVVESHRRISTGFLWWKKAYSVIFGVSLALNEYKRESSGYSDFCVMSRIRALRVLVDLGFDVENTSTLIIKKYPQDLV